MSVRPLPPAATDWIDDNGRPETTLYQYLRELDAEVRSLRTSLAALETYTGVTVRVALNEVRTDPTTAKPTIPAL